MGLSINDSVYSCLFFFLTGLHFFHLLVGLFLCCLFFWSCSFPCKSLFIINLLYHKAFITNRGFVNFVSRAYLLNSLSVYYLHLKAFHFSLHRSNLVQKLILCLYSLLSWIQFQHLLVFFSRRFLCVFMCQIEFC